MNERMMAAADTSNLAPNVGASSATTNMKYASKEKRRADAKERIGVNNNRGRR